MLGVGLPSAQFFCLDFQSGHSASKRSVFPRSKHAGLFLPGPNHVPFVRNRLPNLHPLPSISGIAVLPHFVSDRLVSRNSFSFYGAHFRLAPVHFTPEMFKSAFLFSLMFAY